MVLSSKYGTRENPLDIQDEQELGNADEVEAEAGTKVKAGVEAGAGKGKAAEEGVRGGMCRFQVLKNIWIDGGNGVDIKSKHVGYRDDQKSAIQACKQFCCSVQECAHFSYHLGYCYARSKHGSHSRQQPSNSGGFSGILYHRILEH